MGTPAHPTIRRAPPRRINRTPSAAQLRRRNAFIKCVVFWHSTITNAHAAKWQVYAARHHYTNRKGKYICLTSWSAFLHINLYRSYSGVSLLVTPPDD